MARPPSSNINCDLKPGFIPIFCFQSKLFLSPAQVELQLVKNLKQRQGVQGTSRDALGGDKGASTSPWGQLFMPEQHSLPVWDPLGRALFPTARSPGGRPTPASCQGAQVGLDRSASWKLNTPYLVSVRRARSSWSSSLFLSPSHRPPPYPIQCVRLARLFAHA